MAMRHSRVCATSKWWIFSKMAQGDEAFGKNKLYQRVIYWNNTLTDFLAGKIKVPHVRLRLRVWGWLEVKIIYKYPKGHFTSLSCLSKPGKKSAMRDLKGIELVRWYWHLLECSSYYYYDDFGKMKSYYLTGTSYSALLPLSCALLIFPAKAFSPAGAVFITYFLTHF
jgi:hypothetical protein